MTDKQEVCLSHRPCWCPLCSDYLVLCVYTAGVWAPCPPLVWVREGQSLLFLHPPTLPGEWMSHFIDHLLKASSGTRGENTIPQYWCPSYSPLPRTGRLFWRRVPQTSRLLISVSGFIGVFTVYPECSIPITHPIYCQENLLYSKYLPLNWNKTYNLSYLRNCFSNPRFFSSRKFSYSKLNMF